MPRARVVLDQSGRFCGISFDCPACKWPDGKPIPHLIETDWMPPGATRTAHPRPDFWQFDGNLDMPTVSPSILRRWHPENGQPPKYVCHSFVRGGRIEFCGDCTHELSGKTVDLPEVAIQ